MVDSFRVRILSLCIFGLGFVGVVAFRQWNISIAAYFFTTTAFAILLIEGLRKPISEFYLVVDILLILGFWLKPTVHIVTGNPFLEAAGDFSLDHLNQSFYVSGIIAIYLAALQFAITRYKFKPLTPPNKLYHPHVLEGVLLVVSLIFCFYNWDLGFFRVGLPSKTNLFFPASTLFYWFLGPGGAFLTFLLASPSFRVRSSVAVLVAFPFFGITTLSRNTLMYFCYPLFIKFFKNLKDWKRGILFSVIAVSFLAFAVIQISNLRVALFSAKIAADAKAKKSPDTHPAKVDEPTLELKPRMELNHTRTQMSEMLIDRWVGIEGLLVAMQNRDDKNFLGLATEDPKLNPNSLYRDLSHSPYPKHGALLFSTFPGPIGLIFMAQSFYLIVLGLFAYSILLILSYALIEKFTWGLSKSALIWWAAMNVVQISIFPIQSTKIYLSFLVLCILISILYKKFNDLCAKDNF